MSTISITYTRTLVQDVTVTVDQILDSIPSAMVPEIRAALVAWVDGDGADDIPEAAWSVIQDYALDKLADRDPSTVDETVELDEVTVSV